MASCAVGRRAASPGRPCASWHGLPGAPVTLDGTLAARGDPTAGPSAARMPEARAARALTPGPGGGYGRRVVKDRYFYFPSPA